MAADGTIGDIMDALETALAFNGEDFDFNQQGQVLRGRYVQPPQPQFIALSNPSFKRVEGPPMGYRETRCVVDIVCWAPSTGGTVHDRSKDSLAMLHQVINALDVARDTPANALGQLRELELDVGSLDSEVDGTPPGFCIAWVTLSFRYKTQRGL